MTGDLPGLSAPSSLETEEALLGALLLDPQIALDEAREAGLRPEHFFKETHAEIFRAIEGLEKIYQPVDQVTVAEALKGRGSLEKCGGPAYLAKLYDGIGLAANSKKYAQIIIDRAVLRRLISVSTRLAEACQGSPPEADEVLDWAEAEIFKVRGERLSDGLLQVSEQTGAIFEKLQDLKEKRRQGLALTGLSSGFSDLDWLTGGFQASDLIILAGRPGMGKTALALNLTLNAALPGQRQRYRQSPAAAVLFFSLEMSGEQLLLRLICQLGGFNLQALRTGDISDEDINRLTYVMNDLSQARIFIDTGSPRILEMRAKARRLKSQLLSEGHNLGLVVVDYLQLMRAGDRRGYDSREQEISEISRSLKSLAKELNLPILALSQLNREVEKRSGRDKKPKLSDLRESGAIEQDADLIAFVNRPEAYPENRDKEELRGQAELLIEKHRNGPTGGVSLYFKKECSTFLPVAREEA